MSKTITIGDLTYLQHAIDDVLGYLTDNSCSDPDCCGGPFYGRSEYEEGVAYLKNELGIEIDENS